MKPKIKKGTKVKPKPYVLERYSDRITENEIYTVELIDFQLSVYDDFHRTYWSIIERSFEIVPSECLLGGE